MNVSTQLDQELDHMWACRNTFPPVAETIAYAWDPDSLSLERREFIDRLYRENPTYRDMVDDLRKHRRHYEGNSGHSSCGETVFQHPADDGH